LAESENEQELPLSLMGEVILGVALGFTLSLGTFVFMIVSGALGDSRAVLLGGLVVLVAAVFATVVRVHASPAGRARLVPYLIGTCVLLYVVF
jgi:hypothetical protein